MTRVIDPQKMNEQFAHSFNLREVDALLALYEPDALLQADAAGPVHQGLQDIRSVLSGLLTVPGRMRSINNFCLDLGEVALLRADWDITLDNGEVIASGSSAELVRRQPGGHWLYAIDHAVGASVARVI